MLIHGECLHELKSLDADSIDSLITDPPAGIFFMGKKWDHGDDFVLRMSEIYKECLRVLKPGAHGLVWAIPRTSHWTATALELAGFEIRDCISHLFGSGFPKSTNLLKQLQKSEDICICNSHEKIKTTSCMPSVSNSIHPEKQNSFKQSEILFEQMQRDCQKSRSEVECTSQADCPPWEKGMDGGFSELLSIENVRGEESCLERGEIYGTGQGVCNDKIPETSQSESERICSSAYPNSGKDVGPSSFRHGSSSSSQSQSCGQSQKQFENISNSHRTLDRTSQSGLSCSKCGKSKIESFEGLGTGLKPAVEFWWLIRKPCSEKTVAKNVLLHGTGGLNIDASRIPVAKDDPNHCGPSVPFTGRYFNVSDGKSSGRPSENLSSKGRFPANLVLSHNPDCDEQCTEGCAVEMLDEQSGILKTGGAGTHGEKIKGNVTSFGGIRKPRDTSNSSGPASRFFYCAKASKKDRNEGLEGMPEKEKGAIANAKVDNTLKGPTNALRPDKPTLSANHHPTVKSTKLMEYLIRLITPPQGAVLDPFMGSGSTGVAAKRLGFNFIGIEKEKEYFDITEKRIEH